MPPATNLDRIRAWVEGRLAPEEAARLERDLAQDPELAELCERYRDVHALTAAEEPIPPCRVSFEELERRMAAERRVPTWPRRAAAAALVLLAGGALAWVALRRGGAPGPGPGVPTPVQVPALARVELRSIALEPEPVVEKPLVVPEVLASYDPRGDEGVRWLSDMQEALFVSRASRRPVLVFGTQPDCPWCAQLRATVLREPEVLGLIDRYVPFEWDLSTLSEKEAQAVMERRGYPLFEVWSYGDEALMNFSGMPTAHQFEEMLHQGLERADATGEVPEWDEVRDLARRWERARASAAQGRVAEAQAALRDLARRDAGGPFAEACVDALGRIAVTARAELLEVRELAAQDAPAARARLEAAVERYADTDFEPDLRAVLDAWPLAEPFPELVGAGG